jgi:hypothetical protein
MDWDNRTQTEARASGVEETTPAWQCVTEGQTQTCVLRRACLVLA